MRDPKKLYKNATQPLSRLTVANLAGGIDSISPATQEPVDAPSILSRSSMTSLIPWRGSQTSDPAAALTASSSSGLFIPTFATFDLAQYVTSWTLLPNYIYNAVCVRPSEGVEERTT